MLASKYCFVSNLRDCRHDHFLALSRPKSVASVCKNLCKNEALSASPSMCIKKFANFADLPSQIGLDLIDFEKQKNR